MMTLGKGKKLLLAALLLVAVVLAVVFGWSRPNLVYSISVSQFLQRGLVDQTVRVRGTLVHGSLCRVTNECGYRFVLQDSFGWIADGGTDSSSPLRLSVAYDECIIPDTFRDVPGMDIEVSVEGQRCQGCHDFQATRVMAKCPSKYEIGRPPLRSLAPTPLCKSLPRM